MIITYKFEVIEDLKAHERLIVGVVMEKIEWLNSYRAETATFAEIDLALANNTIVGALTGYLNSDKKLIAVTDTSRAS